MYIKIITILILNSIQKQFNQMHLIKNEMNSSIASKSLRQNLPPRKSTLWVGNLDATVTEQDLYRIFNEVGPVSSVRVCTDAVSRRSLGYAYVNFADNSSAQKALDIKNYEEVFGRSMRLMWSQRDPTTRQSAMGNLFIKNLDKKIDARSLHDTLSQFGPILSCKVATQLNGVSKGYGFVHFECEEDANECLAQVNGKEIEGKQVTLRPFLSRTHRLGNKEFCYTNVFVKNLPKQINTDKLCELFETHGKITSAIVVTDPQGESKNFGFVNFSSPEQARKAIDEKQGYLLDGDDGAKSELIVLKAQKKSERVAFLARQFEDRKRERIAKYHGLNLYVKNFPIDFDDAELRKLFSEFGEITSCKIMRDATGSSKGFGFVCYSTATEARRALTEMKTRTGVVGKPLYISIAQTKEARRKQLETQFRIRTSSQHSIRSLGLIAPFSHDENSSKPQVGRRLRNVHSVTINNRAGIGGRGRGSYRGWRMDAGNRRRHFDSYSRTMVSHKRGKLDFSEMASLTEKQRKCRIGEEIYPMVQKVQPEFAGKITGMLLDMELGELINLVENQAQLEENVKAAMQVLQHSGIVMKAADKFK